MRGKQWRNTMNTWREEAICGNKALFRCEGENWFFLAQDRNQWRAPENTAINLQIPWKAENFLTERALASQGEPCTTELVLLLQATFGYKSSSCRANTVSDCYLAGNQFESPPVEPDVVIFLSYFNSMPWQHKKFVSERERKTEGNKQRRTPKINYALRLC